MYEVRFAPSSRTLIAGGKEEKVFNYQLYNIATGESRFTSLGYGLEMTGLAYGMDSTLAFATDSMITVLNPIPGKDFLFPRFSEGATRCHALAFASNHEWLAGATYEYSDNKVVIWDLRKEGEEVVSIPAEMAVWEMIFSADDRYLMCEFEDFNTGAKAIGIIDLDSMDMTKAWEGSDINYSPTHNEFVFWYKGGIAALSLDSLQFSRLLSYYEEEPLGMALTADGKHIGVTLEDRVLLLDYFTGDVVSEVIGQSQYTSDVRFTPQGDKLVFNGIGGYLNIWSGRTGDLNRPKEHDGFITLMDFDTLGRYLATVATDSFIVVWDMAEDTVIWKAKCNGNDFYSVSFHPSGTLLMVVEGKEMLFYDPATGQYFEEYYAMLEEEGLATFYGPQGLHIAVVTAEAIYSTPMSNTDAFVISEEYSARYIIFDPLERYLIAGGASDTIKCWDLMTGDLMKSFVYAGRQVNALAMTDDSKLLASGYDNGQIVLWDFDSIRFIGFIESGQNHINSLSFSHDGRFLVCSSLDGTVRLFETVTYRPVVDIYAFPDGSWVVVDSSGRFDASDGTNIPHLHYRVDLNDSPYEYEFIELRQLSRRYYDPYLLQKHLGFRKTPLKDVDSFGVIAMYPKVTLEGSDEKTLKITLLNRGGGFGPVRIAINGKEVPHDLRIVIPDADSVTLRYNLLRHSALRADTVNVVSVSAFNREGYLESDVVTFSFTPSGLSRSKQRLFAIVVGVSDYVGEKIDLDFSSADAESFANTLEMGATRMFGEGQAHIALLTTSADAESWPNKKNIQRAFARVQEQATSEDLLVIYFSGHGIEHGEDWHFLTADASDIEFKDEAVRAAQTVSGKELYAWIQGIARSNQALILDACASGKMAEQLATGRSGISEAQRIALESLKDHQSMYVLAGSAADAESYEAGIFGQGLLTYSLLLSLKAGEGLNQRYLADVGRMFSFAEAKVPEYASMVRQVQKPLIRIPHGGESFAIGLFDEATREQIHLPSPKPLFLRSKLEDEQTWSDHLSLSDKLNEHLSRVRSLPNMPMLIESENLPSAFSIKGRYNVAAGKIVVTVRVFRGMEQVATFELSHTDADVLARTILETTIAELRAKKMM